MALARTRASSSSCVAEARISSRRCAASLVIARRSGIEPGLGSRPLFLKRQFRSGDLRFPFLQLARSLGERRPVRPQRTALLLERLCFAVGPLARLLPLPPRIASRRSMRSEA